MVRLCYTVVGKPPIIFSAFIRYCTEIILEEPVAAVFRVEDQDVHSHWFENFRPPNAHLKRKKKFVLRE